MRSFDWGKGGCWRVMTMGVKWGFGVVSGWEKDYHWLTVASWGYGKERVGVGGGACASHAHWLTASCVLCVVGGDWLLLLVVWLWSRVWRWVRGYYGGELATVSVLMKVLEEERVGLCSLEGCWGCDGVFPHQMTQWWCGVQLLV